MNRKNMSIIDLLKSVVGTDEFGATKGCDCPVCQMRRENAAKQPGNVEEPEIVIQTVAYFATNEDSITIGHTVATDTDTTQRIAIRIGSDTDGMLFKIHEARLIIDALQMAIERIEY